MSNQTRTVAVTGASGLVGRRLVPALERAGYSVLRYVRRAAGRVDEAHWDPDAGEIETRPLQEVRAVVHLASENVGERWTDEKKRRIRESRVGGTGLLADTLASMESPPPVLISASGIGIYGDRGTEVLTEDSAPGDDFLASVSQEWEAAATPARERGIRVVHTRFGMVLAPEGGALRRMAPFFKLGVGGPVGGGRQYVSWIAPDDLVRVVLRAIEDDALEGPVNTVAPNPVTNAEFARALGRALRRPALLPVPGPAVRLLYGEMADTVLKGQRARPRRLEQIGFDFRFPTIESALQHEYRG